jgi:hypothetical protein
VQPFLARIHSADTKLMDALAAMKCLLKMQQAMGVRNSDVDRTHDSLFDQRAAVVGPGVDVYGTE